MSFTRKKSLERRKKAGEPYLRPRTSNTRPGECCALKPLEPPTYSVRTVEHTKSLIKLQKLVEDFRKYEGADRKSDVEDALVAKVIRTVWRYQPFGDTGGGLAVVGFPARRLHSSSEDVHGQEPPSPGGICSCSKFSCYYHPSIG